VSRRYLLTIEYDGAPFVGWQRQDNGPSVQAVLEEAALSFCQHTVLVYGAGRTDSGVHALGQAAHVDLPRAYPDDTVRDALNAHMRASPVSVLNAQGVDDSVHARFSAVERRYLYRILARRAPPALERGRLWHVPAPLDAAAMHRAARALVGRHDFSTFRDSQCQADSPVRTLDGLSVSRRGDEVVVTSRAQSFLHRQVRSMVGTLVEVGTGRWHEGDVMNALMARDRQACGTVAPAHGLYLERVVYPASAGVSPNANDMA
jgi:tRNA pseudouridine38-40 synthase